MLAQARAFLKFIYFFEPRQEYLIFLLRLHLNVSMLFRQIPEYSLKFSHGRIILITY